LEQLEEIIFTLVTFNVGCEEAELVAPLDPEAEAELPPLDSPQTLTSWPTWSESFDVSPASW